MMTPYTRDRFQVMMHLECFRTKRHKGGKLNYVYYMDDPSQIVVRAVFVRKYDPSICMPIFNRTGGFNYMGAEHGPGGTMYPPILDYFDVVGSEGGTFNPNNPDHTSSISVLEAMKMYGKGFVALLFQEQNSARALNLQGSVAITNCLKGARVGGKQSDKGGLRKDGEVVRRQERDEFHSFTSTMNRRNC
jgi:hypothetical protein